MVFCRCPKRTAVSEKCALRRYIETIVPAVALFFALRVAVVEAYRVDSGSMENTLLAGDVLLANKFLYGIRIPFTDYRLPGVRDPKPGDVIVFKSPQNPAKNFIKRCVATEGQTVQIRDKVLYVDGKEVAAPARGKFIDYRILPYGVSPRDNYGPVTVSPGMVFVLGDNRDNSNDSRFWGELPTTAIMGKAMVRYFSWDGNKQVPVWDLAHKIRWSRMGDIIR